MGETFVSTCLKYEPCDEQFEALWLLFRAADPRATAIN
jgi:hypothetical protein